jgi:hypothetical protein
MSSQSDGDINVVSLPKNIKFKNTLVTHNIYFSLVDLISKKILSLSNYQALKTDIELVKTVCNIVENCVRKGNSKSATPIDKSKLVVDALIKVYNLNATEQLVVQGIINFLYNNYHIKKLSYYKYIKNYLINCTKPKNS